MKAHEAFAGNLRAFFELNDLTAHGIGKEGKVPQKTVWTCLSGTVVPSVNTVAHVGDVVGIDGSILTRKIYSPKQLRHSKRVGLIADDLMNLNFDQLKIVADMVKGLMPDASAESAI